jgi:excisionase family DNA binding protein
MIKILDQKYLTIADVATEFNRTVPTIYKWIQTGKLTGTRCGNQYLFTEDDIKRYIDVCREQ